MKNQGSIYWGVEAVNNVYSGLQNSSLNHVLSRLISQGDIAAAFPNLSKLHVAVIVRILPVTTATVEHTFSSMKLKKTRLQSGMGEDKLEHTMRMVVRNSSMKLYEMIVDNYKIAYIQTFLIITHNLSIFHFL